MYSFNKYSFSMDGGWKVTGARGTCSYGIAVVSEKVSQSGKKQVRVRYSTRMSTDFIYFSH